MSAIGFILEWIDRGIEPQSPPDPRFPQGMDLDISAGAIRHCTTALPYPARRCGYYVIECERCGLVTMVTTAGRPDDPRTVRLACKSKETVQ